MRILYIGAVTSSYKILKSILENTDQAICGVVSQKTAKRNADYADLSQIALEHQIKFFTTDDINSEECYEFIQKQSPDVIYCFGWSQIIKDPIIQIPVQGIYGIHPAELPKNRGRHPLIWALFLGLEETACTIFKINQGVDDGDIVLQEKIKIDQQDYAQDLYRKMTETYISMAQRLPNKIEQGAFVKQDPDKVNYWRKRSMKDGKLDFRMNSKALFNLIRALSKPYHGAHIEYKEQDICVWRSELGSSTMENIEPGKVLSIIGNRIEVKSYDASLILTEHDFNELPKVGEYL